MSKDSNQQVVEEEEIRRGDKVVIYAKVQAHAFKLTITPEQVGDERWKLAVTVQDANDYYAYDGLAKRLEQTLDKLAGRVAGLLETLRIGKASAIPPNPRDVKSRVTETLKEAGIEIN